jgi:hypothetical protein
MSHTKHSRTALVGSVVACFLLSGCFGSGGDQEPTATHTRTHQPRATSSTPTDVPTSDATSSATPGGPSTALVRFSPKSGGKHLDECQRLEPGDDPAEFLYYPVVLTPTTTVALDSVATEHTQGVLDAGTWVAPVAVTPETGTFKGWPPKYVAHDPNLQWSARTAANGATLEAGTSYNVFFRLQVDPTPGDSEVTGIRLDYHETSASSSLGLSVTWVAHTTFSMSC